jgi:flagellar protein FlgJ
MVDINNNSGMYSDFNALNDLKVESKNATAPTLKKVAKQFEAIFMQMILKNMRSSNELMSGDLFKSSQTDMYNEMYDKQMAMNMTSGLGDKIAEFLQNNNHGPVKTLEQSDLGTPAVSDAKGLNPLMQMMKQGINKVKAFTSQEDFLDALTPLAKKAAKNLGTDHRLLLAQTALETNWGKDIIAHNNGRSSNNLFGIKSTKAWEGESVVTRTHEYVEGQKTAQYSPFRSYRSLDESFNDYVTLLTKSSRYQKLEHTSSPEEFAKELQSAGYSTDPKYADKLINIMSRLPE